MNRSEFEAIFQGPQRWQQVGLYFLSRFAITWAGKALFSVVVIIAFALSGCTTLPYNPADMSAEQLTAAAKDKNASVVCAIGNTPYGRAVIVTVNLDQKVIVQGTVTVDDTCKTTITNAPAPKL